MSTPTPGSTLQQRQQAVYTALRSTLGGADPRVRSLFELWLQEFAAQPQFVVASFVARAAQAAGLDDATRASLIRQLFTLMLKRPDELAAVPSDWLAGSTTPQATHGSPNAAIKPVAAPSGADGNAANSVFSVMAVHMLQPVLQANRGREPLLAEMFSAAFSQSDPGRALASWLREGASAVLPHTSAANLKSAIHALYLLACDALGPVAADQLLASAVQEANALPAAHRFSPEQLL